MNVGSLAATFLQNVGMCELIVARISPISASWEMITSCHYGLQLFTVLDNFNG